MIKLYSFVKELYLIVFGFCGYIYPSKIFYRSLKGINFSLTACIYSLYGIYLLLHGNHDKLSKLTKKHHIVLYYRAYSLFLQGDFNSAYTYVMIFLSKYSSHREGIYLLSDIYKELNKKESAFTVLCQYNIVDKYKTWIKLSNLVENEQDYIQLKKLFEECVEKKIFREEIKILPCLAMGAQRGEKYEEAINIWKRIYSLSRGRDLYSTHNKIKPEFAKKALQSLVDNTSKSGIKLFLISGTLLGFIRDGDFLQHDSDLDLGVFEGFDEYKLKEAIYAAGCFVIMPQRSQHCLRIRHINGTPIDIFTHYRNNIGYYHSGVKCSWHNSLFGLKKVSFYGVDIFIPDIPEKYLEENYGVDWMIKKEYFDSAKDCPNSKIENEYEMKIHNMKCSL